MAFIVKEGGEIIMDKEFTDEEIKIHQIITKRICDYHSECRDCILMGEYGCIRGAIYSFMREHMKPKTNADKFKETFGFPVFELHQLSAEEEGIWLEREYKEGVKQS